MPMSGLKDIDLKQAEQTLAVSNTPLFLLRRLRADLSVQGIATTFSSDDILRELKRLLSKKPASLSDAARPYAYLVALSFLNSASFLQQAAQLKAKYHGWFPYLAQVLIETFTPTSVQPIQIKPKVTQEASPSLQA